MKRMIEPEGLVAIDSLTDTDTEAPLTSLSVNEKRVSELSGKIKADWWSLRADLRPMSDYGIGKRS